MFTFIWDQILIKPIFNLVVFLYDQVVFGEFGLAIILVTIIIRLIILKPTIKAAKAQKAMAKLQPKIAELQKRLKNDKQKLAQETMALYKKEGVNPLGSCLPLFIQMPLLIGLFWVLFKHIPGQRFDLLYNFVQKPASFDTSFFGLFDLVTKPKITLENASHYGWQIALALLAAGTQFYQSKMMLPKKQKKVSFLDKKPTMEEEKAQLMSDFSRQITYIMPAVIFFVSLTLPAALALSWSTGAIFAIVTQYYVIGPAKEKKDE